LEGTAVVRRVSATALACLPVGALAVITPDAAALGDVLVASSGSVKTAPLSSRENPDSGELIAEDGHLSLLLGRRLF